MRFRVGTMKTSTLALTLGATIRLTRFVVTDQLGQWLIHMPIEERQQAYLDEHYWHLREKFTFDEIATDISAGYLHAPLWWKVSEMRKCPWCVGYWLGAGVLAGSILTEDTKAEAAWRFILGTLSLNVVANGVAGLPALDLYGLNTDDEHTHTEDSET